MTRPPQTENYILDALLSIDMGTGAELPPETLAQLHERGLARTLANGVELTHSGKWRLSRLRKLAGRSQEKVSRPPGV